MNTQINYMDLTLVVEYEFIKGETNNTGHPDSRQEDIPDKVNIESVLHEGYEAIELLSDFVICDLENIILKETQNEL